MTILSKRLDPFFSLANPFLPAANIKEEKEKFLVQLAVPGLKKEDFKIELKEKLMDISGADDDFDPVCLRNAHWELIKLDMIDLSNELVLE